MAAIDDLTTTLSKFKAGMADANLALQEKNINVSDLTISNLGAKIRSIVIPTAYTFTVSPTSIWWESPAVVPVDGEKIEVVSKDSSGNYVSWSHTLSGDHGYFTIDNITETGLSIKPSSLTTTVDRNMTITFKQNTSGITRTVSISFRAETGGIIPIED